MNPAASSNPKIPATVPPNHKVVHVEHPDKEHPGQNLVGDFLVKRLPMGLIAQVGVEIARRNGGLPNVDEGTDDINSMLAHFTFSIVVAPEWWNPEGCYDLSLLRKVFNEIMEYERTFRGGVQQQAPSAP